MTDSKTPFERAGYTSEDWFEVLKHHAEGSEFTSGEKVKLWKDDGTEAPKFTNEAGNQKWCLRFENIKPLKHPIKHICTFGDVFTTIPDGVYLEVSYTKDITTIYLDNFNFPCETEERLKEVMQAIQTLFKQEEVV